MTTNVELRDAYYEWIESVLAKKGAMTKAAVIAAQSNVDKFSQRNLDIALKVLEIATINGYRDITWAINNYNKDYKVGYSVAPQPAVRTTQSAPPPRKRLSDEVF